MKEILYQEGKDSTFSQDGVVYQLDTLLELAYGRPIIQFPLSNVYWLLDEDHQTTESDWEERVVNADLTKPILVWKSRSYGWVVVDGMHRCHKARRLKRKGLPARVLTDADMRAAVV